MTLSVFTMSDRVNIQEILNLAPYELNVNSDLYNRLKQIEDRDSELGISKATTVQGLISSILEVNQSIATSRSDGFTIKSEEIVGEVQLEYFDNKRSDQGLMYRRDNLINRLKTELMYVAVNPNNIIPVDGVWDDSSHEFEWILSDR